MGNKFTLIIESDNKNDSIPQTTVSGIVSFNKEKWEYEASGGDLNQHNSTGEDEMTAILNHLKKRFPPLS